MVVASGEGDWIRSGGDIGKSGYFVSARDLKRASQPGESRRMKETQGEDIERTIRPLDRTPGNVLNPSPPLERSRTGIKLRFFARQK